MQAQTLDPKLALAALFAEERARLVSLCAYWSGRPEAAEDLAQEALAEAWRLRAKLVDPSGAARWLRAVARNVCKRWRRAEGRRMALAAPRPTAPLGGAAEPPSLSVAGRPHTPDGWPADVDLEIELERDQLAELLDRALGALPAETRAALVQRYVLELPQAEIAGRLGLTEGAVEARLHRGRVSLRRLLATDLRAEAGAYGLLDAPGGGPRRAWQATRIWCPICGQHKLHGQVPRGGQRDFELHCPRCSWAPNTFLAQSRPMPELAGVKGFQATLNRFMTFMHRYLAPGLNGQPIRCWRCGQVAALTPELPAHAVPYPGLGRRGVSVNCANCGLSSYSDIYGLALDTPAAQAFWKAHGRRMRTLPEQALEAGGQPAWRVRFEALHSSAALDVLLAQAGYRVLGVQP